MYDILFESPLIIDGSGSAPYRANVATLGDTIAFIGREHVRAKRVIEASRLTLVPGFIDVHAHSEVYALNTKNAGMKLAQGITSDISGNCGIGVFPLNGNRDLLKPLNDDVLGKCGVPFSWSDFRSFTSTLRQSGCGINMGFLQPHAPLRIAVMGEDASRAATDDEIGKMCDLLDKSLSEGCYGFSTGLYYNPCSFADERELEALLCVTAAHGGLFSVHMRSESDEIIEAAEEVLSLALRCSVRLEISHLKIIGDANQDKLPALLSLIHSYRDRGLEVSFDQYPYDFGSTSLFSLLPPRYLSLSRSELRFALQLESEREAMKREILYPEGWESLYTVVGPERISIMHLDSRSDLDGRSLASLSSSPLDSLFDILSDESGAAVMSDVTESESTLEAIMQDDLMHFGTDALYSSFPPHPRSQNATLEFLKTYVLSKKLFTLEKGISILTHRNAALMHIGDRGIVREGAAADLVLLDIDNPEIVIKSVFVNGVPAVEEGRMTGCLSGRILLEK